VNLRRAGGALDLIRDDGARPLVVGHRGAAAVAPENTRAALEAGIASGADLVEFDVSPGLVLAHSEAERPDETLTLDDALELLGASGVGLHVDVKLPGYEEEVVAAIDRHDLRGRTLVSTAYAATSRRVARLAPGLPVAIGYPRDRLGVSGFSWPRALQRSGAAALRTAMPLRIPVLLRQSRATTLSLHHTLCSRAAVAAAHRSGAAVLAWTANDPASVTRLTNAGVDGIVSDDPEMALATLLAP
jgi:glycerophosphoryl diester phosphodiesterase